MFFKKSKPVELNIAQLYKDLKASPRNGAVAGINRIVQYLADKGLSKEQTAYILASIWHETAQWMQPIREGATRYGPNYSDQSARNAVATIHAKRIISTNYALPAGPYRQSYYGRGLIQITWYDNYLKFSKILGKPLDKSPDLALDWDVALPIVYIGMRDGVFRPGNTLAGIKTSADFIKARNIVNGDGKKYGAHIAGIADAFLKNMQ